MAFYSTYILPRVIDFAMKDRRLSPLRGELLKAAHGEVAEIGFGTGMNLFHYSSDVKKLYAIEPSKEIFKRSERRRYPFKGEVVPLFSFADRIPLDKSSVDFVVSTFTLCSVPSTLAVLTEVKRILKPGGKFLFLEHGLAPDRSVQKWQNRLTPLQKRIGGGCHFNRNILGLLADACFDVESCKKLYIDGIPKVAGYVAMGTGSTA
jgi:ubiquinone/menaquinone biosynthesis C-methylase UbiE